MKKIFTLIVLSMTFLNAMSIQWTGITADRPSPARVELVSSIVESSTIHFALDGFATKEVATVRGPALLLGLEDATPLLLKGAPELLKLTASVIIPDLAGMQVEVLNSSYRDYENILVAPSKGNLTRDIDPSSIPYEFGKEYEKDEFFPGNLAGLREPYIVRDYRGQTIIVYPFQYNPVTRTLRVYYDITVRISKASETGANPLIRTRPLLKMDAQFSNIYNSHFLNAGNSRYTPVEEFGNMLIISYGAFMETMQPFVQWKKEIGYPIEMVDVATIGNSAAIKSYIANYYNTKGLTFVVLVGDAPQVPSSSTSAGDSDNDYTYVVGNDHYPDLFIGRFSAENINQVETQVQRTLTYEKNPPMDVDWLSICTGIGSDQGPGDDNEYDYQHIRNIGTDLLGFTYTYNNELFDGSQGGNDDPGNPSPSQVAADVNAGTGIINYCGHGSDVSWGTSGFSNTDVNNLTNHNMLPFIWSVACVNGNFVNGTCFAEAWLRATNGGEPTGAIAFLGATINQSWNPPMVGEDEMDDILVESYANNIRRTYAAISMEGCMLMNDECGADGEVMTDTWTVFGDPSVMVRTTMPQSMTVTHDQVLLIGSSQLFVSCNADGARATLTMNGSILSTGLVQNGSVMLTFNPLMTNGTARLTITAFNYLPYTADIDVIPANGPFVLMDSYTVNDNMGNGNGLMDYDEFIRLNMKMKNMGIADAYAVQVTLSANDPLITITDNSEIYDTIRAGQSVNINDAFALKVSSAIPDQHQVLFTLTSTDGTATWQCNFSSTFNAPVLNINSLTIDDQASGNGNGQLDPGETVDMTINYTNTGHATAYNVNSYLEGQSGFVEILNPNQVFASIGFFGIFEKTFTVNVSATSPEGIVVNFMNELTMGNMAVTKVYPKKIAAKIEDFETGDFSKFSWVQGGNQPWQIISDYPYEGFYSIRSGVITNSQSSEISISYQVMIPDSITFYRKVSSESNDKLRFIINGQIMGEWSGTSTGWRREAFPVTAGTKTFKWVYQKDGSGSGGADRAWLDYIVFPPPVALTIWAGPDDQDCTGNTYQLLESAGTDFVQILWGTSGTGTFNDNTVMHPIYTPSGEDIGDGQVTLSLTLTDDGGNSVEDGMILGFYTLPDAPPTPQGPDYVDLTVVQTSDYTTTGLTGINEYTWYLAPPEAGTIIGAGAVATVIWSPSYMGSALVSVAGINDCGEGVKSEGFSVTVYNVVGVPEIKDNMQVTVMPNPSTGKFILGMNNAGNGKINFRITNLLGSVVYEKEIVNPAIGSMIPVDLTQMPEGIYLLTVRTSEVLVTKKLVIH